MKKLKLTNILGILGTTLATYMFLLVFWALHTGNTSLSEPIAYAQIPNPPDCTINLSNFTGNGTTAVFDNRFIGCVTWTMAVQSSTFSAVSVTFQSATGAVTAGTWGSYAGTTSSGSNPITSTTGQISTFTTGTAITPWLRALVAVTGTGNLNGVIYGYKSGSVGSGGGGGGGATGPTGPSGPSGPTGPSGGFPSTNQNTRAIGAGFDGGGSAITSSSVVYFTVPFACTITTGYDITVDTGTIRFDVWKIATGTAIPTVTNSILTGGFLAISSGTALHAATSSLFTTTTSAVNDIYAVEVEAVSGATKASLIVPCTTSS